jgi:hypothetical protein
VEISPQVLPAVRAEAAAAAGVRHGEIGDDISLD